MERGRGTVLVTGGGAGIGRRCCEVLADHGYDVAALGRRASKLTDFESSGRILAVSCDVREPDDMAAAVDRARSELGPITGLVNCAGIIIEQPVEQITLDALREQMRTNVEGTLIAIQACLDDLKSSHGSIVNFSSMLTQRPLPNAVAYSATKGAIEAMTRSLALELAPHGVRVNVILPSLVRSDIYIDNGMAPADYDAMLVSLASIFPLGRVGEPDDVAGLVRFLVSDESSWMTGVSINVDGGRGIG